MSNALSRERERLVECFHEPHFRSSRLAASKMGNREDGRQECSKRNFGDVSGMRGLSKDAWGFLCLFPN